MGTLTLVVGVGAVAFAAGIFVYRNNTKLFSKYADKADVLFDELKKEIQDLKDKLDKK